MQLRMLHCGPKLGVTLLLMGLIASAATNAANISANSTNYREIVRKLGPGDTLVLEPGTYLSGLSLGHLAGSSEMPIVIRGPADRSAVFRANDCCNTVQLTDTSFVHVSNLTLDGVGTNGSFGVDSRGACHHITIENLKIVNYGAQQQVVGISSKGPAWNWVIRRNTIIGAGTGIYLGNSDGTAPFVNGIVEYNVVLDPIGYAMQIKHQLSRPAGVGLPVGDSRTLIRHNVFSKANRAAIGGEARPNLLLGHFPLSGSGTHDRYEVYGNFFYQNPTEALFQAEGNLVVHDNLFVNTAGDAIRVAPHNDMPRDVVVYNNTVVATGLGIVVAGANPGNKQRIVGNASFAARPVAGPNAYDNVTGPYGAAGDYLRKPYAKPGELDLLPLPKRLSKVKLVLGDLSRYTDGAKDFNGTPRVGKFVGAYEGEGDNPGWKPSLEVKHLPKQH